MRARLVHALYLECVHEFAFSSLHFLLSLLNELQHTFASDAKNERMNEPTNDYEAEPAM